MAQYTSSDVAEQQKSGLSPMSEDATESGGKKSMMDKIKDKTKLKTKKLRNKLKPGSNTEADAATGDKVEEGSSSSSSSSDEENDAPAINSFTGITQPERQRELDSSRNSVNREGAFGGSADTSTVDDAGLSKQFEGLSTDESKDRNTMDARAGGNVDVSSAKTGSQEDRAVDKRVDQELGDSIVTAKLKGGNLSGPVADESTQSSDKGISEPGKTWSQWVGEKVGYGRDTSAAKLPSTGTPSSETGDYSDVRPNDVDVGKTDETSRVAKGTTDGSTDAAKQSYTQKFTGAIYGAKDSLMTSATPGEHEKALSQKVTETVSNLPTTIKSTLGFGGKSAPGASTPTTTPVSGVSSISSPLPKEESAAAPQSPGIVSRFTSMFGKKSPGESGDTLPPSAAESTTDIPTTASGPL